MGRGEKDKRKVQLTPEHSVVWEASSSKVLMMKMKEISIPVHLLVLMLLLPNNLVKAGLVFEDNEVVADNRDVCAPDQELVLASVGSCGCCVLPTVEEVLLSSSFTRGKGEGSKLNPGGPKNQGKSNDVTRMRVNMFSEYLAHCLGC